MDRGSLLEQFQCRLPLRLPALQPQSRIHVYLTMVVKERPKRPLFIMLCILLALAATHEIIHKICVKKNDFGFSLWKLLNSPLPTLHPLCKICDGFSLQALIFMAFLLKNIVLKRNWSRFHFSLTEVASKKPQINMQEFYFRSCIKLL